MKRVLLAIILALIGFALLAKADSRQPQRIPVTYTMHGTVIDIDYKLDIVYLEDSTGNVWGKYDADDYDIGDPVLITFATNNTQDYLDDSALYAWYNP